MEAELEAELTPVGGLPAVPVQAIEAWWFLFPDAVEAVRYSVVIWWAWLYGWLRYDLRGGSVRCGHFPSARDPEELAHLQ